MGIEPRILRLVRLFLRVAVLGFTGAVQPHEHEASVQFGQIRGAEYAQIVYIAAGLGIRVIRVPDGPAGRISVFFLQYVVVLLADHHPLLLRLRGRQSVIKRHPWLSVILCCVNTRCTCWAGLLESLAKRH